jgi:O-methyltransferase involved in polyketide biosynthesis
MSIPYEENPMKQALAAVITLALVALVVAGCGKSADQLKMEGDLSKQITALHDGLMAKMPQVKELLAKIPELSAQGEMLANKYPKQAEGLKTDGLKSASEMLVKAKSSMETWMKTFKPYDVSMKHDDVMKALTTQKDDLTKMKAEFDTAVTGATTSVESYSKTIEGLMAKTVAKKK